jgi:gliding motility-associated-like protein
MYAKIFLTFVFNCIISYQSIAQCSSFKIIADKSNICTPDIIRFHVQNPVLGSSYAWNLGNGVINGSDTLYRFLTIPGTINATVIITLPNGSTCTVSENAIATVNNIPEPQFSSLRTLLCNGPDTITLTDITPKSLKRSWVIDGTNYSNTSKSILHSFVSIGSKKVSLIVTDSNGCKGVKEFNDTIQINNNPNFNFDADIKSGCVPQTITYKLTNNPVVSTYTKTYSWSFSGVSNTRDTGTTPASRLYNNKGSFNTNLSVKVTNGCTYVIPKPAIVNLGDTVVLGLTSNPSSICSDKKITFYQTTKLLEGNLIWSFTGLPNSGIMSNNDSAIIAATGHGSLNVDITYHHNGCISTKSAPKFVQVKGVKANFTSSNNFHCLVPHTVDLINNSDSLDATSLTYKWRILNSGSVYKTSADFNPQFQFTTMPAIYDVELIAIGDNGCNDTFTRYDYIYQEPLELVFNVAPYKVCIGQEFNIGNFTKPGSYLVPDEFKWYFYDKNDASILDSSTLRSPNFSYNNLGFYDILGIGYNSFGCTDTLRMADIIEVVTPTLAFEIPDSIKCLGTPLSLRGISTPISAGFNHLWDFTNLQDGTHSNAIGAITSICLPKIGEYNAKYTHSIGNGCVASDSIPVYINGILATINLEKTSGCAPLVVNPKAIVSTNYHQGSTSNIVSYAWSVFPNAGVVTSGLNTSSPYLKFTENGDFTITLVVTNSAGCSHTATSAPILTGVRAGFSIEDTKICLGDTLVVHDNSYNGVTDINWTLSPTTAISVINTPSAIVKIVASEPGSFVLRQVASSNGACFDTAYSPFEVISVIANFEAVDSFLQCAPVYAEFQSLSSNADTLIWDFGAGETFQTTNSSAGTIYAKNSGWKRGFDISLIAKNVEGCSDTVIKYDYMVVAGPNPSFEMENIEGCEPLQVMFRDLSKEQDYFYLNYNDGSALDSSKVGDIIGVHPYYVTSSSALKQSIMPSIIVYDSLGCAEIFEPEDSIIVYRSPYALAQFPNGINLCPPFDVNFKDTGKYVDERKWSINNKFITDQQQGGITLLDSGNYNLQLVVSNGNNCTDTFLQNIRVLEKPQVSFTIQDTICINKVNTYTGAVLNNNPGSYFKWDFGEPSNPGNINSSDFTANFTYLSSGVKDLSLEVGLENGCSETAIRSLVITDEGSIDQPEILYVSFTDNYELEIVFDKSTSPKFKNYSITNGASTDDIYDIYQTKMIKTYIVKPNNVDCYSLHVGDYCDLEGSESAAHCFISLSITSVNPYENELIWSPYVGWSGVKEYSIYRKDENNVFVKIGTVDGNTTSYLDKGLCDQDYEYFVKAIHPTQNYVSNSYKALNRPIYVRNITRTSVSNVSVIGDNKIEIKWEPSTFSEFNHYNLIKYETDLNKLVSTTEISSNSAVDFDVTTNEISYIYQVTEVDRCGYSNLPDREGKSILLKGYYDDGSNLNWSEYQNWAADVKQYNIEVDLDKGFELSHINTKTDRDFVDRKYYKNVPGEYCYRVFAISGDSKDTSYSNVLCLSGDPMVLVPSAFTPNNDGLNEKFNPIVQFIKSGENEDINSFFFSVLNRWGEKVYSTDRFEDGWDGTYRGEDCSQGAYIYHLTATGVTGRKIYMKGTITLLR